MNLTTLPNSLPLKETVMLDFDFLNWSDKEQEEYVKKVCGSLYSLNLDRLGSYGGGKFNYFHYQGVTITDDGKPGMHFDFWFGFAKYLPKRVNFKGFFGDINNERFWDIRGFSLYSDSLFPLEGKEYTLDEKGNYRRKKSREEDAFETVFWRIYHKETLERIEKDLVVLKKSWLPDKRKKESINKELYKANAEYKQERRGSAYKDYMRESFPQYADYLNFLLDDPNFERNFNIPVYVNKYSKE